MQSERKTCHDADAEAEARASPIESLMAAHLYTRSEYKCADGQVCTGTGEQLEARARLGFPGSETLRQLTGGDEPHRHARCCKRRRGSKVKPREAFGAQAALPLR